MTGAAPVSIRPVASWRPKFGRLGEARGRKFTEATNGGVTGYDETKLEVPVCIIREGPGNLHDRHWYTREAIYSGAPVFEGKPAFANHPSRIEESSQPERRIQDVLGYYRNVVARDGADGRAELTATLSLLPPESDLLRHTHALLRKAGTYAESYPGSVLAGISINADGEDAEAEINGERWNAVTKFTSAMSADLVTFPAAGGRLLGMLEAAREALASGRKREAQAMTGKALKDLRAAYGKMTTAKSADERSTAEAEVGSIMAALEYLMPPEEEKPEAPKPDAPKPEPGAEGEAAASAPPPKPTAEGEGALTIQHADEAETEAKKAAETAAKAAESETEGESEKKATEAIEARIGSLREASKVVSEKNPDLAKRLDGIAGSLGEKLVDFRKLRTSLAEAKAQIAFRESVDRARKILHESKLPVGPEGLIEERELWGKPEAEQRAIVASRSKLVAFLESKIAGTPRGKVEGAEPRTAPGVSSNDESIVARMRESGLPTVTK